MKIYAFLSLFIILSCAGGETPNIEAVDPVRQEVVADTALVPPIAPAPAPVVADDSVPRIPSLTYFMGKFKPEEHPDFVKVAREYTDGDPYVLHRETYAAFERMHAAAAADSIQLVIISATRDFARQKWIWERKWKGITLLEGKEKANEVYPDPVDRARAILRYSSMPGTSRHHWGTDIDLNALNNRYFKQGKGKKVYDWLQANAATYGFCQTYSTKGAERPHGYEEERWHWSYLPLAKQLTDYAASALKDTDIGGFMGAEVAPEVGVLKHYVLGINRACH
ncbi:MAG: M15 family metallopeptidase [Bacteroidota bacterium]